MPIDSGGKMSIALIPNREKDIFLSKKPSIFPSLVGKKIGIWGEVNCAWLDSLSSCNEIMRAPTQRVDFAFIPYLSRVSSLANRNIFYPHHWVLADFVHQLDDKCLSNKYDAIVFHKSQFVSYSPYFAVCISLFPWRMLRVTCCMLQVACCAWHLECCILDLQVKV